MAHNKITPRPAIHRILEKVVVDPDSGCWRVEGMLLRKGYTSFRIRHGHAEVAHRIAYEFFLGEIPDGYEVDHTCHNADTSCPGGSSCTHRRCVNPKHLEAVPRQVNLMRGRGPQKTRERYAAATHCRNGHALTPENVRVGKQANGVHTNRFCRTCQREAVRRWRARRVS